MNPRSHSYPGIPSGLRRFAEKKLSANGFSYHAPAFRCALFTNPDTSQAVLLDHRICDTRYPFAYTLYTKEQNALMHKYQGVFRFMADTRNDLADAARILDRLLNREFAEDSIQTKGRHRNWHDIDPTMPEALFEQAFINCYGRRALDRVIREFPVIDMNGRTRWVDYFTRLENQISYPIILRTIPKFLPPYFQTLLLNGDWSNPVLQDTYDVKHSASFLVLYKRPASGLYFPANEIPVISLPRFCPQTSGPPGLPRKTVTLPLPNLLETLITILYTIFVYNTLEVHMLKNITLSADEKLIIRARKKADSEKTTLNSQFRQWLEKYTSMEKNANEYDHLMQQISYAKPMRKYSRDEMNER